jgi:diacylglycerol kinase (ATP)
VGEVVAAAVADGAERIVAVGGDGLVHHVVQHVAGTGCGLGIVPCGTGNDLALGLGLAVDRHGEALAIGRSLGPTTPIDALRTTHGWVASLATLGFSAAVNAHAEALRWPRGSLRYTVATLLELPRLATVGVVLTVDGEAHALEATLLAFGTTAYFGGAMAVCPGARPADGVSDVTVIGPVGRLDLLRTFPKVFRGTHLAHPAVRTLTGVDLALESAGPEVAVWADGEPLGPLPLQATTVAGALHVAGAVPATPAR